MRTPANCTWEIQDEDADVLYVTNMWPDDERPVYGIFVKRQIESLRGAGLKCDVLYIRGYLGVRVYALASMWFLTNRRNLARRYRLLHAHAGETALAISLASGVPKFASYCGDDILGQARPDGTLSATAKLRRWVIRQSARACVTTITKSQEMAVALPMSVRGNNAVIPNGVDEALFAPRDVLDARQTLGWHPDERLVIFVATRPYESRKRLSLAEQAVAHAESAVGPIRLVVADNVAPESLPIMMCAADCMLLTSRMEGSPNSVKEALMCNLPVVSTDVGDVAALLDGVARSAVCNDTPSALGGALIDVLESGERSDGRARSTHLRQDAIADRILTLYTDAGAPIQFHSYPITVLD